MLKSIINRFKKKPEPTGGIPTAGAVLAEQESKKLERLCRDREVINDTLIALLGARGLPMRVELSELHMNARARREEVLRAWTDVKNSLPAKGYKVEEFTSGVWLISSAK